MPSNKLMSTNLMLSQLDAQPTSAFNQHINHSRTTTLALKENINNNHVDEAIGSIIPNPHYYDLSQLEYGPEILGEGAFGKVYKGTLPDQTPCAVKVMHKQEERDKKAFNHELSLLDHLAGKNTPHIVSFYGATTSSLVFEYMECGTLRNFIASGAYPIISLTVRLEWMKQIADGIAYLHDEAHMLHNDLKPHNLLLTRDELGRIIIKIADFGSGNFIGGKNILKRPGTPVWQAPEVITSQIYTPASDMFSFAVICTEILTGNHHFYYEIMQAETKQFNAKQITQEQYDDLRIEKIKTYVCNEGRPILPENPTNITTLIKTTWDQNPEKRPSAKNFSNEIASELQRLTENQNNNNQVNSNDFAQLSGVPTLLGEGTFGKVYKVTLAENTFRAVKIMSYQTKKQKQLFDNEAKVLNQLVNQTHDNVVEFYNVNFSHDLNYGYFVMEYIDGNTLTNVLRQPNYAETYPLVLRVKWMQHLASGVAYLHDQIGIIHCDLNSNNLLMMKDKHDNLTVKITDFGSGHLRNEETIFDKPGTKQWQAPEVILENNCSKDSDVYSTAIILWQIMAGEHHLYKEECKEVAKKFEAKTLTYEDYDKARNKIIEKIVKFGDRPKIPADCPTRVAKWIKRAWHQDPDQRPSAKLLSEKLSNDNILEPQKTSCSIM